MTNPLLIDPRSSALLVMDYQIDTLGKFMAPADSAAVLSVLPKLLAAGPPTCWSFTSSSPFAPAIRRSTRATRYFLSLPKTGFSRLLAKPFLRFE